MNLNKTKKSINRTIKMKEKTTKIEINKLNDDIKSAIKKMDKQQIRFLVKTYYTLQDERIAMFGRVRELTKNDEPNSFYEWLAENMQALENRIKQALKVYVLSTPVGEWLISITGVAEVISAGLLSNLDINTDATLKDENGEYVKVYGRNPSSFWRVSGLDPSQKRVRGEKLSYNPDLKRLAFIIGESFVKVQNLKSDFYGKLFAQYKATLVEKNERGEFKESAAKILTEKNFSKTTEAFKHLSNGMLPPAQIHARARRHTVKIFLVHVWQVMYWFKYKETPKLPWIMLQDEHGSYIDMPNKPFGGKIKSSTVKKIEDDAAVVKVDKVKVKSTKKKTK
jgi:hypothetical protein